MIETGASKEPKIVVFLVNTILLMFLEKFFKTQQQSKEKYFVLSCLLPVQRKRKKKFSFAKPPSPTINPYPFCKINSTSNSKDVHMTQISPISTFHPRP